MFLFWVSLSWLGYLFSYFVWLLNQYLTKVFVCLQNLSYVITFAWKRPFRLSLQQLECLKNVVELPLKHFPFLMIPFQYRLTTSNCSLPLFHQQRIELPLINNDFIRISSDTRNNYAKDIHTKSYNGKARKNTWNYHRRH